MALQSGTLLLEANFVSTLSGGGTFGTNTLSSFFTGSAGGLTINLLPGTGAGKFQNLYVGGQSVVSGSPVSLCLTDGTLKMPDTSATNFADVTFLLIRNNGAANLTVGGGTAAMTTIFGATGTIIIQPGATEILISPSATNGYVVTATTADIIKLVSASGTLAVDLIIAGH